VLLGEVGEKLGLQREGGLQFREGGEEGERDGFGVDSVVFF
jgi:hypothetical protein